eukprot:9581-Heterococcus_DN1.PRE.1
MFTASYSSDGNQSNYYYSMLSNGDDASHDDSIAAKFAVADGDMTSILHAIAGDVTAAITTAPTTTSTNSSNVDDISSGILAALGRAESGIIYAATVDGALNESYKSKLAARLEAIQCTLEICQHTLGRYLDNKRVAFPRLYFVGDSVLLDILSIGTDLVSLQRHLPALFEGIHSFELVDIPVESLAAVMSNSSLAHKQTANSRQHANQQALQQSTHSAQSSSINAKQAQVGAMAVMSANGEKVSLVIQFRAHGAIENWLARLLQAPDQYATFFIIQQYAQVLRQ